MSWSEIAIYAMANAASWIAVQMGFAWVGTRMPVQRFEREFWWSRSFWFEAEGRLYEQIFRIKAWKDASPDGASWFEGGFPKRRLKSRHTDYIARFVAETRRGEAVHWAVIFTLPFFIALNPPEAAPVSIAYALAANLPFIAIQRYNRIRMNRVLEMKKRRHHHVG